MLNTLCKYFLNKEIVLYKRHRQTIPIIENEKNQKDFIFINVLIFWRIFPLPGKYKLKFKIMYLILNIVNPKYIMDINWISKWESLYKIWTSKHKNSKFIVIQHGTYIAGIINDNAHKYTKCDILLTWSNYFTKVFKDYNSGKRTEIITFGNPVYNNKQRNKYVYSNRNNKKILIVPSVIREDRIKFYNELFTQLKGFGLSIYFKGHNYQGQKKNIKGKEVFFPQVKNVNIVTGSLEKILRKNDFDFIISDHSTALLDAIYFKNKVLYFAPVHSKDEYTINQYSKYLKNIFYELQTLNKMEDLYKLISIEGQEELFNSMIYKGDNKLSIKIR